MYNKKLFFFPFGLLKIALADFHKTTLFSLRALSEKVHFYLYINITLTSTWQFKPIETKNK